MNKFQTIRGGWYARYALIGCTHWSSFLFLNLELFTTLVQCVPRKGFVSAVCDTIYTTYISI